MWVSTERSYRLIQTPFKSAKNLSSRQSSGSSDPSYSPSHRHISITRRCIGRLKLSINLLLKLINSCRDGNGMFRLLRLSLTPLSAAELCGGAVRDARFIVGFQQEVLWTRTRVGTHRREQSNTSGSSRRCCFHKGYQLSYAKITRNWRNHAHTISPSIVIADDSIKLH